jgi:hypothetical protein
VEEGGGHDGGVRVHSPSLDSGEVWEGSHTHRRVCDGEEGEGRREAAGEGGGGVVEEERMVAKEGDGGDEEGEEGRMAMPTVGTGGTLASDTRRRRNWSSKTEDTSCSPRDPEACQLWLTSRLQAHLHSNALTATQLPLICKRCKTRSITEFHPSYIASMNVSGGHEKCRSR